MQGDEYKRTGVVCNGTVVYMVSKTADFVVVNSGVDSAWQGLQLEVTA